jgi:hypothetical protein
MLRSNLADPNQIGRLMRIGGIGMRRKMMDTLERWRKKEKRILKKLIGVSTESCIHMYFTTCIFYCMDST